MKELLVFGWLAWIATVIVGPLWLLNRKMEPSEQVAFLKRWEQPLAMAGTAIAIGRIE